MLSFDDGERSVYENAFPYMQAAGIVGTSYIVTDWIGSEAAPGYCTTAQLLEMQAAGWDIANHTMSHPVLPDLSEAEQIAELTGAEAVLTGLGLRASKHVAYPSNQLADAGVMDAAGMLTGRAGTTAAFGINEWTVGNALLDIHGQTVQNTTALATVTGWVDAAIAERTIKGILIHGVTVAAIRLTEWSIANFQAFIDYCVLNDVPFFTIEQLYSEFRHFMYMP